MHLLAQEPPFLIASKEFDENGYYAAIESLLEKESIYNKGSYKNGYYQLLSTYFSFVGEDSLAQKYYDYAFSKSTKRNKQDKDKDKEGNSIDFDLDSFNLDVKDALRYIVDNVGNNKILIINESHHRPQHRVFIKELLFELKEKGFNMYAAEGINYRDTSLYERKYPLQYESGVYTNEPVFGNLIRTAFDLGYDLFGYDTSPKCDYSKNKPNYCRNLREIYQAVNIKKMMDKSPDSKVIIHCGYGHLNEKTDNDWIKMAEYLQLLTGIDPYTINQTAFVERSRAELESQVYRQSVRKTNNASKPFVLLSESDSTWMPSSQNGYYDLQVFWPRISYINNRPSYLHSQREVNPYFISQVEKKTTESVLIQAYKIKEDSSAVPIDQFITEYDNLETTPLILPQGNFRVNIQNAEGAILDTFTIAKDK